MVKKAAAVALGAGVCLCSLFFLGLVLLNNNSIYICIVLHCIALYCLKLYGIVRYCMVLYGIVWYGMVWHGNGMARHGSGMVMVWQWYGNVW